MYHLEEAQITLTLIEENGNEHFVPRQSSILGGNLRNISTQKHAPTDDEDSRLLELELGELQDLQYEPSTKKQTNDLKGDIQSWIDRKKTRSRNSESFSSNF